ncbi:unnamed protein product, partial [Didymodactylos carnosus]
FEKRIYIPLPDASARLSMFKMRIGRNTPHTIKENEWKILSEKSENYSGADIAVVVREALLSPIRRLQQSTHFKRVKNPNAGGPDLWATCSPADPLAEELTLDKIEGDKLCEPPVTMNDMMAALSTQKATVGAKDLKQHEKFTDEYGQEGS